MQSVAQTPLMRQYGEIKRRHPGALLLFRLGDFYELFFDDAVTAARELEITLTARNREKGVPIPMCGVPYHAAEGYIARLLQKGFKVALCDQMEDASTVKGLVRREVTRVLTPGTAAFQLAAGDNNYLAAVARGRPADGEPIGLALLDLSTGEFRATEFRGESPALWLAEELARWAPREVLHAAEAPLFRAQRPEELGTSAPTPLDEWIFTPEFGRQVLESHFGVLSLEGYGLGERPWATAAAGALVHYVKETQRSQVAHVDRLGFYDRQQGLVLDGVTVRNLELIEPLFAGGEGATLRRVLDETATPMGKRLLRQWLLRPAGERAEIEARLQAVAALRADEGGRDLLRRRLAGVQDLERLLARVSLETATPRDLQALNASLDALPELQTLLAAYSAARLQELATRIDPLPALRERIALTLVDEPPAQLANGGAIRAGISAELDELRGLSHNARGALAEIEARERTRTGIGSLKIRFNNVFGYYIEISKPNLKFAPADYERKQTLVNAERFTTSELKELERRILSADERSQVLEQEIFAALQAAAMASAGAVRANAAAVAELDVLADFAHVAARNGYVRPEIVPEGEPAVFEVRAGRHPVVERLGWQGEADRFVPNDLYLDNGRRRIAIITGPNMGGKSTYLRQAALIALLAHMGCFVPAERARVPLLDRIFTRIGASDNLARGRSTFMVEMTEAAAILNQATDRSLVILDELGRGTATYDGLSLAWAMVEYLHDRGAIKTLFATHYHELTALAQHLEGVENLHVVVRESPQGIVFLRKVEPGEASRSYGIEVARLAGLPRAVLDRAREVLRSHENAEQRTSRQLEAPAAPAAAQLTMFTPLDARIAAEIAAADLNGLTPLEALNLLAKLQRQLREGEPSGG